MHVRNESGTVATVDEVTMVGVHEGAQLVRHLTLFNPNGSGHAFTLRIVAIDLNGERVVVRRLFDTVLANDDWPLPQGVVYVLNPGTEFQLVLDVAPTTPIEWSVDIAES